MLSDFLTFSQVFRESSDGSSVEDILKDYAQAIDSGKGGLLLSIVGGKMSEGINFNDKYVHHNTSNKGITIR